MVKLPDSERTIHVIILGAPTMDYLNLMGEERDDAVKMFESLRDAGMWRDHDKAVLTPEFYKYINGRFQNEQDFPKMVARTGGSEFNPCINAKNALAGYGYKLDLTFITTVSDFRSGVRIKKELGLDKKPGEEGYRNISIYPELPPEQQAQVHSRSSYIFLPPAKKFVAKGLGYGNREFIHTGHISEAFGLKKFHLAICSGSAVTTYSQAVAHKFVEEAKERNIDLMFSIPRDLDNQEVRAFCGYTVDNIATIITANTTETNSYYNLGNGDPKQGLEHMRNTLARRTDRHPIAAISDGMNGAYIVLPDNEFIHIPVWNPDTKITDITGAGDGGGGGLLAGLIDGYDNPQSVRCAGLIGAAMSDRIIQQLGAQLPENEAQEAFRMAVKRYRRETPEEKGYPGYRILNSVAEVRSQTI